MDTQGVPDECTMDQELPDADAYAPRDAACALTRWQHFSAWNDVMAAIMKVWRHIRKSDSVNRCQFRAYLKNNDAKFHPDQLWDMGDLAIFEEVSTTGRETKRTRTTRWVAIMILTSPSNCLLRLSPSKCTVLTHPAGEIAIWQRHLICRPTRYTRLCQILPQPKKLASHRR